MTLDELQSAWREQSTRLSQRITVDETLLKSRLLRGIRWRLWSLFGVCCLELLFAALLLVGTLRVLASHLREPFYLVVGILLTVVLTGGIALVANVLLQTARLDFTGSIPLIQRQVERTRLAELQALRWTLLGGVMVWLPLGLFLVESVTGAPVLPRVAPAWLLANLGFGAVVVVAGSVLTRGWSHRESLSGWRALVADALSSHLTREARARLDELRRFIETDCSSDTSPRTESRV